MTRMEGAWYEQRRPGLGVDFVAQIQEVFDRISTTPELYVQICRDVRRRVVRCFPYSVFYKKHYRQ